MQLANLVTPDTRAVLLVEGPSDRAAAETVASRTGVNLADHGVRVVAMGGVTNLGHYLGRLIDGQDLVIGGLYDAGEEGFVRRSLEKFGLGPADSAEAIADLGFFVCVQDLEDEFIRALGEDAVLDVVESEGEMASFRILQNQPAHRDGTVHSQLQRFMGTRSHRKIRYGRQRAEAVELERIPQPLVRLLRLVT